jgi:hypothetical protein
VVVLQVDAVPTTGELDLDGDVDDTVPRGRSV